MRSSSSAVYINSSPAETEPKPMADPANMLSRLSLAAAEKIRQKPQTAPRKNMTPHILKNFDVCNSLI